MFYYRKMLHNYASGLEITEPPSLSDGQIIIQCKSQNDYSSCGNDNEHEEDDFKNKIKNFIHHQKENLEKFKNNEKVQKTQEFAKQFSEQVKEKSKNLYKDIKDYNYKEKGNEIKNKVSKFFNF